jgi:nucleoside-diphosphate-sugar epimerase
MIYGDFKTKIVNETSSSNPKEIYGTMKLAGEVITKGLSNYYNIPYTIIRPSAVYGPKDMNQRVSQIFINKAINGSNINVHGKTERLDFTYIDDLVNGVILASTRKNGINNTFNITNGKGRSLFEFVSILKKHFPKIKFTIKNRDKFRPKRGTLSIKKATKLIGYKPKTTLEKGIYKYLKFLKVI